MGVPIYYQSLITNIITIYYQCHSADIQCNLGTAVSLAFFVGLSLGQCIHHYSFL